MKRLSYLLFALSLFAASFLVNANQPLAYVQGSFCSLQNGGPAPGLMISLVHQYLGRSSPAYTDQYGNFQLLNIPLRSEPYLIEVYWGQRLIYRNQVFVQGPVSMPRICV